MHNITMLLEIINPVLITLLVSLVISVSIQILISLFSYFFKSDKLTDFAYGIAFILVILYSLLKNISPINFIITLMVIVWSIRLITYLVIRINYMKRDTRFNEIRTNFLKNIGFFLFQGISVIIILFPSMLFILSNSNNHMKLSSLLFMITGFMLWLTGLIVEGISDYQKFIFKKLNKSKIKNWIDTGFWKYSRHPNYFGEILCWAGIYVFTLSKFGLIQSIISLISPLYIFILLRYISGVPILEEKSDKKYKNNKKYHEYKNKTNLLIPFSNNKN